MLFVTPLLSLVSPLLHDYSRSVARACEGMLSGEFALQRGGGKEWMDRALADVPLVGPRGESNSSEGRFIEVFRRRGWEQRRYLSIR